MAQSVPLVGDVSEAAPQLRHLSPVGLHGVQCLVVPPLGIHHIAFQLVSDLFVGGERSSALIQLPCEKSGVKPKESMSLIQLWKKIRAFCSLSLP